MSEKPRTSVPQYSALATLSQAALDISADLSIERTLQRIVKAAQELAGTKFAALGVFGEDDTLEVFIHEGMEEAVVQRIPHPPIGLGLLKAIVTERQVIRIDQIADHPMSIGFPEGHPEMQTFLGVPIIAGEEAFGNLYLTDRLDGEAFSDEDEELMVLLATHAAIAIRNARRYQATLQYAEELEARNQELAAVNAVAKAASDYLELRAVLREALDQVLAMTGMQAGEIFLLEEQSDELVLELTSGENEGAFHQIGRFRRGQGFPGIVLETGRPKATTNLKEEVDYLRKDVIKSGFQSFVSVPLMAKGKVIGTLDLASKHAQKLDPQDLALLEAIGHQIGTAVDNARLYEEVARLAVVDERSRIGMDLHDGVIQSIYAVGLTLETVSLLMGDHPNRAKKLLDQAVAGLNDAIRDIRNFILDLRPRRFEGDLGRGLERLVREFQANTMVEVVYSASPQALEAISSNAARAIFLSTQEALANVARHARAEHVYFSIELDEESALIRTTIRDDGAGFDPESESITVGHGLANIRSRSEDLNGRLEIDSAPGMGTALRIELPLNTSPSGEVVS